MRFDVRSTGIVLASEKRWLVRNGYSKNSIKVLGALCKPLFDVSDVIMASKVKMAIRTYQEAKRELVLCGLLSIHKVNANQLVYLIGTKAIVEYEEDHKEREAKRTARLMAESLGYQEIVAENTTDEVHVNYDNTYFTGQIDVPESIPMVDVL